MLRIFLMLLLAAPMFFAFTEPGVDGQTCPTPTNLTVTSKSNGVISFDWSNCATGCSQYLVKYYRYDDSYQSQVFNVSDSEITFTGLAAGRYDFSFATDCGSTSSGFIIVEEVISN